MRAADSEWAGRFPERDDRWWVLLLGPLTRRLSSSTTWARSASGRRASGVRSCTPRGRSMTSGLPAFDIHGPLPTGTTLVEASAGTGKTWTLAALVTRYVADEAFPLDQLLVVTFSRLASQELRERVRQHLEGTVERLESAGTPG